MRLQEYQLSIKRLGISPELVRILPISQKATNLNLSYLGYRVNNSLFLS